MRFPENWRWLPPASSPVSPGGLVAAALPGEDRRPELRRRLAARYAADAVLLCDSGTTALDLALRVASEHAGSPVAGLPAFGCYDLATAAVGAEVQVALYDVEPATLVPDRDSMEAAIGAGAGVVVIAVPFGMLAPWDEITALAERHGAILIEDAAQSHGARWRGRPAGSFGALSVLSFGRGKGWTGGRGGALLARGPLADPVRALETGLDEQDGLETGRSLTVAGALWALGRPSLYRIPASLPGLALGETRYREPSRPRRLARGAAALVLSGEARSDREAAVRRRNGDAYRSALGDLENVGAVKELAGAAPGYLRFPVRLRGRAGGAMPGREANRLGIARTYPAPLADLPALRSRLVAPARQPGAEALIAELVTLPTHSGVRAGDRERILAWLQSGE